MSIVLSVKLNKLVNNKNNNNLSKKLDELYPDTTSKDKNDGINYWKGKRIVSIAEWRKIANSNQAVQKGIEYQRTKEALRYFPDQYTTWLFFPLGVQEELEEATNKWYSEYLELMQYRKNPDYGKTKCAGCLLAKHWEEAAIFLGINKVLARVFDDSPTSSVYPCPVQNRFECPYDRKEEEETKAGDLNVDNLYELEDIAFQVEKAFGGAQEKSKKGEPSVVPIRSAQDVYNALTDRETLDTILQQGLDEEHQKYKDEIVELFMSIKDKVAITDIRYY